MRFGVREICDVTFKANQPMYIGSKFFKKGQPVLYIDTAKTSTLEGASTTVYATGGKGNPRLISWEGEKTLTFTVEDALLSPIGFAVLSGANVFTTPTDAATAYVHMTSIAAVEDTTVHLDLDTDETISKKAPIFVMTYEGNEIGDILEATIAEDGKSIALTETKEGLNRVFVDYYIEKKEKVTELQIDAETFAGYFYVEASTLFRVEENGKDLPAELVIPKVKIQSNFTFNMSNTGDPSTFSFVMDAFPAYTMFNNTKKVLFAMQIIDDTLSAGSQVPVTMNDDKGAIDLDTIYDSDTEEPEDENA